MPLGSGVKIDGKNYVLVNDHDTYVVEDVPAHPDTDARMERRAKYDSFKKGILHRRQDLNPDDTNVYSLNYVNRIEKAGDGLWFAWGGDTRMGDRIFGQRLVSSTQTPSSKPILFGDGSLYSYIGCLQHLYSISGISGGVQQIAISKDFSGIVPAVNITDVAAFNGRIYVAVAQLTNGVADPAKVQNMWVWDQTSATTNWVNPPTPLAAPTWTGSPFTVNGTPGTTRYQYYIIPKGAGVDGPPSTVQVITTGADPLTSANSITLNWNAVTGATSYSVFRQYSGSASFQTGIIATGVAGTTYTDQGASVSAINYTITPQFATGDTGKAIAFAVIRSVLWRAAGAKLWSWDGQQGTWSGESVIGDPTTNIYALDVYQDGLVIFKQDGIYTMNRSGDVFPLFPGFRTLGLNPRPLGQWQGSYFFASDVGMVWEWNGADVKSIGFDFAEAYPFPDGTYGLPNAATKGIALPNFFLVGFNKWNDSTHNASFFFAYDGLGWHPFHYDPNYQACAVGLTGGNVVPTNPTLQFGKITANGVTAAVSYLTQPTLDPILSTSYDTVSQVIFLPLESGIIADEWKVLEGVRIYVENPKAGTVRIAYATDNDIYNLVFTDLGQPQGDKSTTQVFIPVGDLPTWRSLLPKLTLTPSATTASPIVRAIVMRYKQRESQRRSWTLQLFLEEGQMMTNRNKEWRTASQMLNDLDKARQNHNLVQFLDITGETRQVYVQSVGRALKKYGGARVAPSFVAKVVLVEPAVIGS